MKSDEEQKKAKTKKKSLQGELDKPVGKRLKNARVLSDLTQQDVADELGISKQMISVLENKASGGALVDYLILLRSKGADLNQIFNPDNVEV